MKEFNGTERKSETRPKQTRLWKITATQESEEEEEEREKREEWCVFTIHTSCKCLWKQAWGVFQKASLTNSP